MRRTATAATYPSTLASGIAAGLAVAVGALTVISPVAAVATAIMIVPICLLALGERLVRVFLVGVSVLLVGYAFLGRGFAYVGHPPVFIGEAVLGIGLLTIAVVASRLRLTKLHWLMLAFVALGALRTVPYLDRDGINALRDGALWGYAIFAIALSATVERRHFDSLVRLYRKLVPVFLLWVPLAAVFGLLFYSALPRWPGSDAPVLTFKGDMGVHLAAAAAFMLLGLYRGPGTPRWFPESLSWPVILFGAAITGAIIRGGMLAAMVGILAALMLRTSARRRLQFALVTATLVVVSAVGNPTLDLGRTQDVSLRQLGLNIVSVFGETGDTSLDGNKDFRLEWWKDIVGYTLNGPYFWTGKGFGINLADDDGRTVDATHSLRAPHNTHMTVLARMGVPGFIAWVVLQLAFAGSLIAASRRAQRAGAVFWARVDGWLFVYWLSMMVVTMFDPYLESPQGGIWFWCVFGLGLAALRLQRESLEEPGASTKPEPEPA